MKPEHLEALSAMFDGEPADPVGLAEALRDPEAPALLADFASLKAMARDDAARPGDDFYARMAPILRPRRARRAWTSLAWPAIAASVLLLAGLAGYWVRPALELQPPTVLEPPRLPGGPSPAVTAAPPLEIPSPAAEAERGDGPTPGGPPTPALRLRFAQWATGTATVQPQ